MRESEVLCQKYKVSKINKEESDSEGNDEDGKWERGIQKDSGPDSECMESGGNSVKDGVIPGRIWLLSDSLWGELRCNPLLSMQTWAGFHKIPLVTENHKG